ncbi:hypothetical protein E2C01_046808 [Portunus trituberculatus]|uniref:Uncharacterized protein n=1 Tax=Portunus trituberculatus TaxID=210409 RepID=A0A5B7G5R4_PORTR|nr:hypothetical protein [Portunus trituberculatus]
MTGLCEEGVLYHYRGKKGGMLVHNKQLRSNLLSKDDEAEAFSWFNSSLNGYLFLCACAEAAVEWSASGSGEAGRGTILSSLASDVDNIRLPSRGMKLAINHSFDCDFGQGDH